MPQAAKADSTNMPASHREAERGQRFLEALIPMPEHGYGEALIDSLNEEIAALDALNMMLTHALGSGEVMNYVTGIHNIFQRAVDELGEIRKAVEDELMTSKARAIYAYTVYGQLTGQWKAEQDEMNGPMSRLGNMKPYAPVGRKDEGEVTAVQTALAGLRAQQAAADKLTGRQNAELEEALANLRAVVARRWPASVLNIYLDEGKKAMPLAINVLLAEEAGQTITATGA